MYHTTQVLRSRKYLYLLPLKTQNLLQDYNFSSALWYNLVSMAEEMFTKRQALHLPLGMLWAREYLKIVKISSFNEDYCSAVGQLVNSENKAMPLDFQLCVFVNSFWVFHQGFSIWG